MPQQTQHVLLNILLLWTTVISIIQIVLLSLFFTAGQRGLSTSKISFHVSADQTEIAWTAANPNEKLYSTVNRQIRMDGYYFLTLQVTLCEKSPKKEKVMLTINGEVKLEGWIDQNTNSTGVLSRAMELSAGGILKVTITSPKLCINTNESVTHMGIIFITKH
uniref:TNF family profile domain-containing protein n=1 Tax=Oryzias latipes TaxID=8090 RepID=A0A3B3H3Y1_ORYLA